MQIHVVILCRKNAVGLPVDLELAHPDFLLHVDETGFNFNSREDGNVGRQLFVGSTSDGKLLVMSNEKDCRATVMGFTNSLGAPILYFVIIKGS